MLLVTSDGEKFNPVKRSYQLSEMCRLANASRRQVDEWVRDEIIVAPINPGQGKKRDFSFENLFDCSLAKAFSFSGQVRLLREAIRLNRPKDSVLQQVMKTLPEEIGVDNLVEIMNDPKPIIVCVLFIGDAVTGADDTVHMEPLSQIYVSNELRKPTSLLPGIKPRELFRDLSSCYVPSITININATELFCQLAYRLITDKG